MDLAKISISKHAKERYTERIMSKDNIRDANIFMSENDEKICKDIKKMLEYGELIYTGPSITFGRDNRSCETNVYLNGTWVIIVSSNHENVITLFSVDLGLGDEFNKDYIKRLVDKINEAKNNKEEVELHVLEELYMYDDLIMQNEEQIKEYKRLINGLEELNLSYRDITKTLKVKVEKADKEVRDAVATLIGKKIF